jgi:hypothetical protein
MLLDNKAHIPGSVSVPSGGDGGGGGADDCSLMDMTVNSKQSRAGGSTGLAPTAGSPGPFAQGSTTMISPGGVTMLPIVTQNHPLALYTNHDDTGTVFSGGGASNQDARSVKSRTTVLTTGTNSKNKRKLSTKGRRSLSSFTTINTNSDETKKAD